MRKMLEGNLRVSNMIGMDFLVTDAELALTFLDMARASSNEENRSRRTREARRAYDTILKRLPKLKPEPEQLEKLNDLLTVLRKRLIEAGGLSDS